MNSVHDLGGVHGFGPVVNEIDEPVFHHAWERRMFGISLAMGAGRKWCIDQSRHAREQIPPVKYLSSSYYELWFEGVLRLSMNAGLITPQEALDFKLRVPGHEDFVALQKPAIDAMLARGSPSTREVNVPAGFQVGDLVRTRQMNPTRHTRLPRYCRGKQGVVLIDHGVHVYPDTAAHGEGEQPCHLYTVRFAASELWGSDTTASAVHVDCWEPYLEAL